MEEIIKILNKTITTTTIKTLIITFTLFLTLVSPTTATTQLPKANTVNQALTILNHQFPDWQNNYKANEFDCSEMSAFVRDYLIYCNLDAKMQCGRGENVWGYSGWSNHVWVVIDNNNINIECTSLKIRPDSLYTGYTTKYQLPLGALPWEFDYWNSEYMKSKGITMDYFTTTN